MNGRILIAVCGVGDPNFDTKIVACTSNIEKIIKTAPTKYKGKIDFIFFAYDDRLTDELSNYNDCKIVREPGFVGEFIYRYLQQHKVKNYDRIIVMLDDIELQPNFDLNVMLKIQDVHKYDIVSPALTRDSKASHKFMKTRDIKTKDTILHVGFLEFFMYVMNPASKAYGQWLSCFNENTRTMWGIDLLLHQELELKLGLIDNMTIKHMYIGGSRAGGRKEMLQLFDRVCVEKISLPKLKKQSIVIFNKHEKHKH
jgi:hypothetical protein